MLYLQMPSIHEDCKCGKVNHNNFLEYFSWCPSYAEVVQMKIFTDCEIILANIGVFLTEEKEKSCQNQKGKQSNTIKVNIESIPISQKNKQKKMALF